MKDYEQRVTDRILKIIELNQVYLKDNLGEMAKLGYMFDTLWYAGRIAYGFRGTLNKGEQCENNPKYEIMDKIEYKSPEIEDLAYDAWGMHVEESHNPFEFTEFKDVIYGNVTYSDFEKEYLKPNKTFEEWVKVLTNPEFKYHELYPDRRSVAEHLLCVIGNGYSLSKDGFVYDKASGADQDVSGYGQWKLAKFHPDIQKEVDEILAIPEVELVITERAKSIREWQEKRKAENQKHIDEIAETVKKLKKKLEAENLLKEDKDKVDIEKLFTPEKPKPKKHQYYPISNYSIISNFNKKTHPSYIKAGIQICKEILKNQENEHAVNIKFANKFLKKWDTVSTVIDKTKKAK